MKYLVFSIICVTLLSVVAVFAIDARDEMVDRGYECFNLEIAQAQLQFARGQWDKQEIRQARILVRNWKKLCQ